MATLHNSTVTSFGTDKVFRSAVVSGDYLYELRHTWHGGLPRLVVVGLNPPRRADLEDGTTVAVVSRYARRYLYGGFTLLNLYAWRATIPAVLMHALKQGHDVIGPENSIETLATRIEQENYPTVLAAWGRRGQARGLELLRRLGQEFVLDRVSCFGLNRDGSPAHPLHRKWTKCPRPYYSPKWFAERKEETV